MPMRSVKPSRGLARHRWGREQPLSGQSRRRSYPGQTCGLDGCALLQPLPALDETSEIALRWMEAPKWPTLGVGQVLG